MTVGAFFKAEPKAQPVEVAEKSVRYFTNEQITNVFVAALVIHNLAANIARAGLLTAVFLMLSGSRPWTPPAASTIERIERSFFTQLKNTIIGRWKNDGVLSIKEVGGRQVPRLRWPPLLSVTFDISTTKTSTGLSSISVRATWLDKNWKRQMVCLGVRAFKLKDKEVCSAPIAAACLPVRL